MRADEHLILHGLAIKRHATPDEVSDLVGADIEDVKQSLENNVGTGRVSYINGKYALLPGTRMILRGEYSRHYSKARSSESFLAAYERFERINDDLKALITSWQVRPLTSGESVPNDHSDREYDEKIIDQLGKLHDRFMPSLEQLSVEVPRLERYSDKLDTALEKTEHGDLRWVSDMTVPSYHSVWFDLHEDLLCMLGRERVE